MMPKPRSWWTSGLPPGLRGVSFTPENLAEKSAAVLDHAMGTIHGMAAKVMKTIKAIKISERPNKVQVEFGIKLDAEAGAMVARAGTEASIKVTLAGLCRIP